MSQSNPQTIEGTAPSLDEIVEAYDLTILRGPGDWTITDDGGLDLTKDGDAVRGDVAFNGLVRLVETWRYNAGHLRYLFDTMARMIAWRTALDERTNAIGPTSGKQFLELAATLGAILEDQRVAEFGAITYSGCLMIVLSGGLLRLKDDLGATANEWKTTGPLFNSRSVGSIVVASANGFRHADEWAKTQSPTKKQRASQDVLNGVLGSCPLTEGKSPGRCAEVLQLLSSGEFETLASNIFAFAHNIALRVRERVAIEATN
jgi:hypothetical protein